MIHLHNGLPLTDHPAAVAVLRDMADSYGRVPVFLDANPHPHMCGRCKYLTTDSDEDGTFHVCDAVEFPEPIYPCRYIDIYSDEVMRHGATWLLEECQIHRDSIKLIYPDCPDNWLV